MIDGSDRALMKKVAKLHIVLAHLRSEKSNLDFQIRAVRSRFDAAEASVMARYSEQAEGLCGGMAMRSYSLRLKNEYESAVAEIRRTVQEGVREVEMALEADECAAARTLAELKAEVVAISDEVDRLCEGIKSGVSPCETEDDIMKEIREFEAALAAHDAESERRLEAAEVNAEAEERRVRRERAAALRDLREAARPGLVAIAALRSDAERWASQIREWRQELRGLGDSVRRLLSDALRPSRSRRRLT
jgi:hypothetical protein